MCASQYRYDNKDIIHLKNIWRIEIVLTPKQNGWNSTDRCVNKTRTSIYPIYSLSVYKLCALLHETNKVSFRSLFMFYRETFSNHTSNKNNGQKQPNSKVPKKKKSFHIYIVISFSKCTDSIVFRYTAPPTCITVDRSTTDGLLPQSLFCMFASIVCKMFESEFVLSNVCVWLVLVPKMLLLLRCSK